MQVLKTILWALLLVVLVAFSVANWEPLVTVQIWEGLVVDTKIPALVIVSFLIGFLPMWLYHRGERWRLKRRINALENAQKANSLNYARANTETIRDRDGDGIPDSVDPAPDTHADTGDKTAPPPPKDDVT